MHFIDFLFLVFYIYFKLHSLLILAILLNVLFFPLTIFDILNFLFRPVFLLIPGFFFNFLFLASSSLLLLWFFAHISKPKILLFLKISFSIHRSKFAKIPFLFPVLLKNSINLRYSYFGILLIEFKGIASLWYIFLILLPSWFLILLNSTHSFLLVNLITTANHLNSSLYSLFKYSYVRSKILDLFYKFQIIFLFIPVLCYPFNEVLAIELILISSFIVHPIFTLMLTYCSQFPSIFLLMFLFILIIIGSNYLNFAFFLFF